MLEGNPHNHVGGEPSQSCWRGTLTIMLEGNPHNFGDGRGSTGPARITGSPSPAGRANRRSVKTMKVAGNVPIRWVSAGLAIAMAGSACGTIGDDNLPEATAVDASSRPARSGPATREEASAGQIQSARHVAESPTVAAMAIGRTVEVFDTPDGAVTHQLSNPTTNGGPLVFLVRDAAPGWLNVYLPVRPNGSTGWIRATDVELSRHGYRMVIHLADHRLNVWDGDDIVLHASIAVGTERTPTPGGVFYIKELLQPPTDNGPYGSFAYGLSGYSNVLDSFAGGDGVVGIHGTNDPGSIGTDVSAGCIRLTNEQIEYLAGLLPLGTPVEILP